MSYDLIVFDHLKVPCEWKQLSEWFRIHMENDVLPDKTPPVFCAFLENMNKMFPSLDHCPEEKWDYACEYEIHEQFVYMCFGSAIAHQIHHIVKRQAKINNLGFWDVSQFFDKTYPITLPTDRWPLLLEANWIKDGKCFVYHFEEIQKVLTQMKMPQRSSVYLTDRFGNYIQAGGYQDTFIVEIRQYSDAENYQQLRADLKESDLEADSFVPIQNFTVRVPKSQILSAEQMHLLFQAFADEIKTDKLQIFWKQLAL